MLSAITGSAVRHDRNAHRSILVLRGAKILLDEDLAALYGVVTGVLVQAVKRNIARFPADFMFQLTAAEWTALRSQTVIAKPGRGGRRSAPHAFTEQGIAMLSSVLGSECAIAVNIEIMRAFVQLRGLLASNKELARRFDQLEARLDKKLAGAMDVSQQTVASWEVGRRGVPVSNLPLLARTLSVSVEALIGEQTPPARRGPTPKLQQQVERLSRLPQDKQRVVMEMLEGFLNQAACTG